MGLHRHGCAPQAGGCPSDVLSLQCFSSIPTSGSLLPIGGHRSICGVSVLLRERHTELASTSLVVAETAWLLLDRFGPAAQHRFVSTIVGSQVDVVELVVEDWTRILELISTYSDLSLDVVDASTVAVAERLGLEAVATMDERDFRVIRPAHVESFELLPGPA